MIAHVVPISYAYGQIFTFKVAADWHVGHAQCDMKALKRYLVDGANDPDCYLVGNGDLADAIVVKDKRYMKSTDGSDLQNILDELEEEFRNKSRTQLLKAIKSTLTDKILNRQTDTIEKLLSPYQGRILGLGMGNHELTVLKQCSYHILAELAKRLGTVSLGYQWAVTLRFEHAGKGGGHRKSLVFFGNHGWGGGGSTRGGSITKYTKHAAGFEADIFLYGHDHKLQQDKVDFMGIRGNKFVPMAKRIFLCGTFLRTFSHTDEPTWSETRGHHPVSLEGLNIFVQPLREGFKIWSDL